MAVIKMITIGAKSDYPLMVNRLGLSTKCLTGERFYGEPPNRPEALQILKQAVDSGINFLDTADFYGDNVTNRLIVEALYPYPDNLLICVKIGAARKPDQSWQPFDKPENLRASLENNLRSLKQEQLKLVHLRPMGNADNFEEALQSIFRMQEEGKILHVGLSNVSTPYLDIALKMGTVATIENTYSHAQRTTLIQNNRESYGGDVVLGHKSRDEIKLIPFSPLIRGSEKNDNRVAVIAQKYDVTEAQINIAWLLHKSSLILPTPGSPSLNELEKNIKACNIALTDDDMKFLE